ncbi:MAG: hypothetical protein F6J98_48605, partial [Moorea sp. SIO4G2]|nr:hypothetical protein [Moorena sp. SIO4G2]
MLKFLFPTPDSRLPTPDSLFPTPYSLLPIPCSPFPVPFTIELILHLLTQFLKPIIKAIRLNRWSGSNFAKLLSLFLKFSEFIPNFKPCFEPISENFF